MSDTPLSDAWTSLRLIFWTTEFFQKNEIPNPRLDAELLLAHVLKCPRINLYTEHERPVSEKDREKFKGLIQRRIKREPLQYIVGETEFWGLKFKVTPAVLIPRPETELLVEEALKLKPSEILEIGTGSGCIAITLAKQLPEAKIIATDLSKEALSLARENAETHGVVDRIEFLPADIASIIPGDRYADVPPGPPTTIRSRGVNPTLAHRRFDLIVSNPPYIRSGDFPSLQPEVRDFEPRIALDGGPDGLDVIRKILRETPSFLKKEGTLLFEFGDRQGDLLQNLLREGFPFKLKEIRKDYSNHERIAVCFISEGP